MRKLWIILSILYCVIFLDSFFFIDVVMVLIWEWGFFVVLLFLVFLVFEEFVFSGEVIFFEEFVFLLLFLLGLFDGDLFLLVIKYMFGFKCFFC